MWPRCLAVASEVRGAGPFRGLARDAQKHRPPVMPARRPPSGNSVASPRGGWEGGGGRGWEM
eukprot:3029446-Pyramimonas_sp.AAC.1